MPRPRRTWSSAITGGLDAHCSGTVTNNRVYNNAEIGIYAGYSSNVLGNTVYSNSVGIQWDLYYYGGTIANNLVYANSNQGILVVSTYQRLQHSRFPITRCTSRWAMRSSCRTRPMSGSATTSSGSTPATI